MASVHSCPSCGAPVYGQPDGTPCFQCHLAVRQQRPATGWLLPEGYTPDRDDLELQVEQGARALRVHYTARDQELAVTLYGIPPEAATELVEELWVALVPIVTGHPAPNVAPAPAPRRCPMLDGGLPYGRIGQCVLNEGHPGPCEGW